jgi:hypothetical protein
MSINFKSLTPTQENCWRASILIGDAEKKLNNDQLITLLMTVAALEGIALAGL